MLKPPDDSLADCPPAKRRHAWQRLHAALMPDYNGAATACWWVLTLLGAAVLGQALAHVWQQPFDLQFQVAFGCALAMLCGLFPVRIAGAKNAFAAGEVFIMLLLLMLGPQAAVLAAAAEAFVGAARSSKRWTSRLISPSIAAVSMLVMGSGFQAMIERVDQQGTYGVAVVLMLAVAVSVGHLLFNALLITLVTQLKHREPLHLTSWLASYGWVGITCAASALFAGLLYLAFKATGAGVMAGAVPIIIILLLLVLLLHYHFRQRESEQQTEGLPPHCIEPGNRR